MPIIMQTYILLKLNTTVKLTKTDEKTIRTILASCMSTLPPKTEYCLSPLDKLHNCDVMIREDVSRNKINL
ncbi:hypothetical protein JVT61DRAFT_5853 [Boletus reticuloceps]|uniref:Uncharacterized protein n=1 Tax=Boletus reticuloceps TaxID=495285 RepID=A0A8I3ADG6_9AGAM|nr:hypothetical protein JVT61DRAFT_5853 [Boletus reticuloceps]